MTGVNLLVALVTGSNATPPTFSDNQSNTWTALTQKNETGAGGGFSRIYYCYGPTVTSTQTFSVTGAGTFSSAITVGYSGSASSPFDQQNGTGQTIATSTPTGSVTPTQDNELIIYGSEISGTGLDVSSVDVGSIVRHAAGDGATVYAICVAEQIQTTATTRNPTLTFNGTSVGSAAVIATFKAAAAGGGTQGKPLINSGLINHGLVSAGLVG